MRRLSLRAAVALTLPAFFAAPSALAQYASYDSGGGDNQPAIALFSDENYYGDVRDVFDPFNTLTDLAFNDKTRSVAVFAGQWELCEHKEFTGRCVFIREDVSDLGWFGLNGRVTSVRPVYEYTEAQHGLMFTRDKYGYIRYANNETYGYDTWNYGYASSWGLSVSHFGYSDDYYRYGYYSPTWGYDPYGFAWGPRGTTRYTYTTYRRTPRPYVINPYWTGWDYRRPSISTGHWSWRDGRRDGDSWRDWRRDDDSRWGRGGRDWRPRGTSGWGSGSGSGGGGRGDGWGSGGGGRGGDRDDRPPGRDVPGDRWGPGAGGSGSGTAIPTDPRPGRDGRGGEGRGGRGGRGGDWTPRTDTVTPVPADPRPGRGSGGGRGTGSGGGSPPVVTPVPSDPNPGWGGGGGRGGRDGRGGGATPVITPSTPTAPSDPRPGRGGGGFRVPDTTGLSGGPATEGRGGDDWRGRGRTGDDGPRGGGRGDGGGRRSDPAPAAVSPPPPPPPAAPQETRREVSRDTAPRDGGKGSRRRNGDD